MMLNEEDITADEESIALAELVADLVADEEEMEDEMGEREEGES